MIQVVTLVHPAWRSVMEFEPQRCWKIRGRLKYSTKRWEVVKRKYILHRDDNRVQLDLVTAARTSEEGLKNVYLKPEGEKGIRKGKRGTVLLTQPYR